MSNKANAFCSKHCKQPTYTADAVDEFLQELEADRLGALPWYKGEYSANSKIKYEYSIVDPKNVLLTIAPNLLELIVSDSLEEIEKEKDIETIKTVCANGFYAKVYYNNFEYFAMFDTVNKELIINKVNKYNKKYDENGAMSIEYLVTRTLDGVLKIHYEEIQVTNEVASGSNIIQIPSEHIAQETFIELIPLDDATIAYLAQYMTSVVYYWPGLALINLKAGEIESATLNFGVKITPCQHNLIKPKIIINTSILYA